ncbi:oligoribonuclease, mitochondrial-like [Plakobranchus ocellatus]|uniref:Oligoribonuclease, mitochondrial-like n=1 Tax=Plakobranchus ocellatus TaxID=259542 RepID=A0AAV4BZA9_9GAST|nr:oligoribonuclease, mitochondrial-like [Plakobranchus ocellatus]
MSTAAVDADLDSSRLVWVDLEMTGLNVEKERIIEIACLVTEGDLTIVAKGPNIVIHQSDELLNSMDEWCTEHHGQSGLTEAVRNSKVSTEEAEAKVLKFVSQHVPQGKCPLAGNSVGTDKLFLDRFMPRLAKYLHYRVVDVSTVKELCRRWYPEDFKRAPSKKLTHRAMDDILESIEELKFYKYTVFKS